MSTGQQPQTCSIGKSTYGPRQHGAPNRSENKGACVCFTCNKSGTGSWQEQWGGGGSETLQHMPSQLLFVFNPVKVLIAKKLNFKKSPKNMWRKYKERRNSRDTKRKEQNRLPLTTTGVGTGWRVWKPRPFCTAAQCESSVPGLPALKVNLLSRNLPESLDSKNKTPP